MQPREDKRSMVRMVAEENGDGKMEQFRGGKEVATTAE